MKRIRLAISFILLGFLMLSSCDKKNAYLVNRRTATPEKIEQIKEAQRTKAKEREVKAQRKAKEEKEERKKVEAKAQQKAREEEEAERARAREEAKRSDGNLVVPQQSLTNVTTFSSAVVTQPQSPLLPAPPSTPIDMTEIDKISHNIRSTENKLKKATPGHFQMILSC
ncbi:hypothetical protein AGMMS50233_10730 [Endomicrobiia bacterium]|nr:hypothetical protein AGMMS50233_10730 [Endomicrobiia bacterium]